MIKCLEPVFHQINAILSLYVDDDTVISKLKNLFVIVQTEINKISDNINIPVMGDDNLFTLFEAFLQELYAKKFIYIPNGTAGLAITDSFEKFIDTQEPDNMRVLK